MHSMREQLLGYPELMELFGRQQHGSPSLLRTCGTVAGILGRAGMEVPAAVEAAQGLIWSALGFVVLDAGGTQAAAGQAPEVQYAMALASLSDEERASIEPFLPHLATRRFDSLYDSLVRRLIAGIEAELTD
jgi:hypothetical protein